MVFSPEIVIVTLLQVACVGCMSIGTKATSNSICEDQGHHLVQPIDDYDNTELQNSMVANNITEMWLDIELSARFWHNAQDGIPLYDQGCYLFHDLKHLNNEPIKKLTDVETCILNCTGENAEFAGLQADNGMLRSEVVCMCTRRVPVMQRRADIECNAICDSRFTACGSTLHNTVRIYSTAANVDTTWSWDDKPRNSFLCGVQDSHSYLLSAWNCSEKLSFSCLIGSNLVPTDSRMSWFESSWRCFIDKGQIMFAGSGWTNVKAWMWQPESRFGHTARYTRWAPGHPVSFDGACVIIGRDGLWRTSNCSDTKHYKCARDYSSHDDPTTSHTINPSSLSVHINVEEFTTVKPPTTLDYNYGTLDNDLDDGKATDTITTLVVAFGIIVVVCVFAGQLVFAGVHRCRRSRELGQQARDVIGSPSANNRIDLRTSYLNPIALAMESIRSGPEHVSPIYGLGRLSHHPYDVIDEVPYNDAANGYETIPDEALDQIPPTRTKYLSIIDDAPGAEINDGETSVDYNQHLYANTPDGERETHDLDVTDITMSSTTALE